MDADDSKKMQAVLYAFANKFLDVTDLKDIKEAIGMTKLGQMIHEDGMIEGIIWVSQEEGMKKKCVVEKIKQRFSMTEDEAQKYIDKYWK